MHNLATAKEPLCLSGNKYEKRFCGKGIFYSSNNGHLQAEMYCTRLSETNWKYILINYNTLVSFQRANCTFVLSYKAWLSNIIFLSWVAYLRRSRSNCCTIKNKLHNYTTPKWIFTLFLNALSVRIPIQMINEWILKCHDLQPSSAERPILDRFS